MVLARLVRLATGGAYLRKPATTIGHLTGQGIRIRIYVQGSQSGVFLSNQGPGQQGASISAGRSSQGSESETKPHMASQTASHLQRRLPILGSSQELLQSRCYASEVTAAIVTVNQDRNLGISHVEAWRHGSRIYWIIVAL